MNLTLNDKLDIGKYKGKTVEQVYKEDVGYLAWLRKTREEKNGDRTYFAPEVHVLIDHAIENSSHLRSTFESWCVTIDGLAPTVSLEQQIREEKSKEAYSGWGAF